MFPKKNYKDICYSEISDDILVFHLADSYLHDEELVITGLSEFIELVSYKKPRYIIIDKKTVKIQSFNILKEYLKHQGVDELIDSGVKKICFIVSDERYKELNGNVGYRGIMAFTDYESCLKEIDEHRKSTQSPSGSV